jgi:hypothetical protein
MSNDADPNSEFVFVSLYIMLGDADSSITGTAVLSRKEWETNVEKFEKFLETKDLAHVTRESEFFGEYEVNMECYTVKSCTAEEAETLKKFLKEDYGFRFPSEFIDR